MWSVRQAEQEKASFDFRRAPPDNKTLTKLKDQRKQEWTAQTGEAWPRWGRVWTWVAPAPMAPTAPIESRFADGVTAMMTTKIFWLKNFNRRKLLAKNTQLS